MLMSSIQLSVVIPVYNEEQGLQALFDRLYPALDQLGISYEVLFVNDGSRDRSAAILREQFEKRPDVTRVILFNGNFGQHMAIMEEGHDYVGSIRRKRNDSWWRHAASRMVNGLRERTTSIKMTDQGCMFRAYDRRIIDAINSCKEVNTFIPALAYTFARNPAEVVVGHEERAAGESKYSLYSLIRLNFDLMTSFSLIPLQLFSMLGITISVLSGFFVVFLFVRRLMIGPEAEGLFTLFAIAFFLIGITLFGIGILGEYIGRIYQQVRHRPRYLVEAILEVQDKRQEARVKKKAESEFHH
jgi:undecaprenyl-phosphate 4-deoxy-4-formamido-L-arabinose transferase